MKLSIKTIDKDATLFKQVSKNVDFKDTGWEKEVLAIEQFCIDTACFGIAAIQVGIPKRIVYLKNTNPAGYKDSKDFEEMRIFINPVVVSRRGHTKYWEACLSTGDYIGLVSRPYEIVLDYYDRNAVKRRDLFQGFESTVLSHELHHLDGIEHIDVAEKVLQMSDTARMKFREKNPYQILSKTCDFELIEKNQMECVLGKKR
ncbi:MAG: peptide deformylase [Rickettsiales bacterium]|jgi:peptide deformylase|nr:peptide deformylase [Rickettsiales bacterium]